ncbi:MAG: PLP-dependent aminotransferase family protein [Pseudomonadales bacterium]
MSIAQLFHLSPNSDFSLQKQIRTQIVTAIQNGQIPLEKPLPSSRALAAQLGVARNTVVLAYENLLEDGYILSRQRSGYFVNPDTLATPLIDPQLSLPQGGEPNWPQRMKSTPSLYRSIDKPKNWVEYDYPFTYGQLDYALFPTNHWRECCRDALSVSAIKEWATDQLDYDDPLLIEQIQTRSLPRRGIWAKPDQILITVGAQQALYMLVRLMLDRDSTLGLENPGYVDVRNIAALNQTKIKPLAVDAEGLVVNAEINECDCIYVTPSHQSPTTVTMPIARRYDLLQRAVDHDVLIIEDDYESEINFAANPTPALKSLDHNDRVIYVGSLSKTLAPGLRMGYVVAPANVISELRALRRLMVRHPASNNQRAVALFLARGYQDTLTRHLAKTYRQRCITMMDALDSELNGDLAGAARMPGFGGSSCWVQGPADLDADKLKLLALAEGIIIEPGSVHFMQADPPLNYFRLGFSSVPDERIAEGIKRLAALIPGAMRN